MIDAVVSLERTDEKMNLAVEELLHREGIMRDAHLDYTCVITDDLGEPVATGSCFGNTLRCMAVDSRYRGTGLLNRIIRHLSEYELERGYTHLFIYTKSREAMFFSELGFYEIACVDKMVSFLENRKNGFACYIDRLRRESRKAESERCAEDDGADRKIGDGVCAMGGGSGREPDGAIVMNANPFTKGHQYLVEQAAVCGRLHLFVVSEDRSFFPFSVRKELIRLGTAHLPNIILHDTGAYLISQATFPSYFLKEETAVCEAHARLDVTVFSRIAKELGITARFVGQECDSMVTAVYNRIMHEQLAHAGIRVYEIPRRQIEGEVISASKIRQWIHEKTPMLARPFLPDTTWEFLCSGEGGKIMRAIEEAEEVVHY